MNINSINLLTKIKNASIRKKEVCLIENTKFNQKIIELLYTEGYIQSFKVDNSCKNIIITLRYSYNKDIFTNFKLISTSGFLKYLSYKELCKLSFKRNNIILSTNKGLLTGYNCKINKIGGKLCFIC
jgi:small subunit ribosomal protein S8